MSVKKMTYDELYTSMVQNFTIEKNDTEYTLGDYMLMRAKSKKETAVAPVGSSELAVVREVKEPPLVAAFTFVNEKLKIKEAPVKNRTIRAFPLRTSASAFCSALVICSLVIGCAFFGFKALTGNLDNTVVVTEDEGAIENDTVSTERA